MTMIKFLIIFITIWQIIIGQPKNIDPFGNCWPESTGYYDLACFVLDGRSKEIEIINEKHACGIYIKVLNPRMFDKHCEFDIFLIQVCKMKKYFLNVDFFEFTESRHIKML